MQVDVDHELRRAIDRSIVYAAIVMDLEDLNVVGLDEDAAEEVREYAYEERFHCGTCIVRAVMGVVWPAVEEYITWLKNGGASV